MSRQAVQAPQATGPRYSLLVASPEITDDGVTWVEGWDFQPEACGTGGRLAPVFCGSTGQMVVPDQPDVVGGDPFVVWAADKCSTLSAGSRDFAGRARRQLVATESQQAADELWTGSLNGTGYGIDNPWLAAPTSDTVTDGSNGVAPDVALALLTGGLAACSPERGMIHVTPQVLAALVTAGSVMRDGNVWLDAMGNTVVADAGYDGSGPGGTPAGATQWAYATSMIRHRLTPIDTYPSAGLDSSTVDSATNTVRIYAWRLVGLVSTWCCHLAAEVALPVPAVGPPS